MLRATQSEILDHEGVPEDLVGRAYCDLSKIHRWLGDTRSVINAIRNDPLPVRQILDVGCGTGVVAEEVRRRLGIDVIGVDIRTYSCTKRTRVSIVQADATCDPLPRADVAYSMHLGHHLSESELAAVIRNVGRFCRRFILIDLVRHQLPLTLFRLFVVPWVSPITAEDGRRSVRRSYTPQELRSIAASALAGTDAVVQSSLAPLYVRQVLDISYDPYSRLGSSQRAQVLAVRS